MNFLRFFALFLVSLQRTEGQEIQRAEFILQSTASGYVFTSHLLFTLDQLSEVTCASECLWRASCVSFTFTEVLQPGNCRGHSKLMTFSEASRSEIGTKTYGLLNVAEWAERNCSSNTDCGTTPDVECYTGKCVCTPGYFYSDSMNQCMRDCPEASLTSNFTEYYHGGIHSHNIDTFYNTSAAECKQHCLDNPECRNAEWKYSGNFQCNLHKATALTVPDTYWDEGSSGWTFWQRNCL